MAWTGCCATIIPTTHTQTHTHTHTHTHTQLSCCGVVRSPAVLFCGPFNYRAFLCEVYFRGCSPLSPRSPRTMGSFTCGQNQTQADMDAGSGFASLALRSAGDWIPTARLSSLTIKRALIRKKSKICCYFRANHNLYSLCFTGGNCCYLGAHSLFLSHR